MRTAIPVASELFWACPDCGAPAGDDCHPTCPSAAASYVVLVEAELAEPVCHPDVTSAAADLCFCQGTGGRAAA